MRQPEPLKTIVDEVKCIQCGWVHAAVPLRFAIDHSESVLQFNDYFRCFRCKHPSETFVPASPDDSPVGCSLQPVVVCAAPQGIRYGDKL